MAWVGYREFNADKTVRRLPRLDTRPATWNELTLPGQIPKWDAGPRASPSGREQPAGPGQSDRPEFGSVRAEDLRMAMLLHFPFR